MGYLWSGRFFYTTCVCAFAQIYEASKNKIRCIYSKVLSISRLVAEVAKNNAFSAFDIPYQRMFDAACYYIEVPRQSIIDGLLKFTTSHISSLSAM